MKETTVTNSTDPLTLQISEKLTIHHLLKYHQDNIQLLHEKGLHIDASQVTEIDTAALQLLAYYILWMKEHHGSVSWTPPPSLYFMEQVENAGMKNVFI